MTDLNDTLIDITRTAAQLHCDPATPDLAKRLERARKAGRDIAALALAPGQVLVDLEAAKNCSHLWHTSNEHGLNVINFCPDCCEGRAK